MALPIESSVVTNSNDSTTKTTKAQHQTAATTRILKSTTMPPSVMKVQQCRDDDNSDDNDVELATTRLLKEPENKSSLDHRGGSNSPAGSLSKPSPPRGGGSGSTTTEGKKNNLMGSSAVASCLLYSFFSVSMVLVNKSLASSYQHLINGNLNILLVVFQAAVACVCVHFCKKLRWVEYTVSVDTLRQWAPVNIFFCLMLFTGMASLQNNSVPMVTIFKNITNVLVTAGDYVIFGNPAEGLVIAAFAVMLGGAVAAAWNDIAMTPAGLFWMAANCLSSAGYVLYMKHATQTVKMSKFGMVFCNNVLCIVFLLPVAIASEQVDIFVNTPALHTADYVGKNAFAGLVGFFLNFAALSCVAATGPTTYAIVGSLNKVPIAILGYFLFNDVISRDTWFFIAVSMLGGFLYSFAQIRRSSRLKKQQQAKQQQQLQQQQQQQQQLTK